MGREPTDAQRAEAAKLPNVRLATSRYRLEWEPEAWTDVDAAGEWLLSLAHDEGADLVHLNGYAHAALPFDVPVISVAHSDVLTWWRAVKGEDAPSEWDEYRRRVAIGLANADAVIAVSGALLESMRQHYAAIANPTVIYNTVQPSRCTLSLKDPVILGAGRLWDEGKNLSLLDRTALTLPWPTLLAGDRTHAHLGCAELVSAVPLGRLSREDMALALTRAAIFAHPALYEPFGLAPLEAAHAGCALVLADIPTLREVWGDAAIYANPRDTDAFRAALALLIENPALRLDFADRARRRASHYSRIRFTRAYLDLYRTLTTGHPDALHPESSRVPLTR